ncbi:MAG: DUF6389 family protein [Thermaurantiacus sp.]
MPLEVERHRAALEAALAASAPSARAKLAAIRATLPPKARGVDIGIMMDADGEGSVSVLLYLDGPDLFVLQQAIEPYWKLFESSFETRVVDGVIVPGVPILHPGDPPANDDGNPDDLLPVHASSAEACRAWIAGLWAELGGMGLPARTFLDCGIGPEGAQPLAP